MPLGKRDNLLRRRKRTRKTRRKTVRQSAECHPAVSTVPARNPGPNWRLASVGPVPPQPATSIASPTAPRGTCIPPRLPATVLSGGQTGLETELQWPSTARRLMVARAEPLSETRTPDAATPCPETRRPLPDYNEPASQKAASSESASSESASSETACLEKKPTEPYRINPCPLKSVTGIARYKRAYFGRALQPALNARDSESAQAPRREAAGRTLPPVPLKPATAPRAAQKPSPRSTCPPQSPPSASDAPFRRLSRPALCGVPEAGSTPPRQTCAAAHAPRCPSADLDRHASVQH